MERLAPSNHLKPLLMAAGVERDPETARAVSDALIEIDRAAWLPAAVLIEYAQRRSPGDGTLTFALAELSLLNSQYRPAADMFNFLASKTGWGEALRRLAVCLLRAGDQAGAAEVLDRALRANAPPQDPEFAAFADEISGSRGWCGLDNTGAVSGVADEILLDGVPVTSPLPAGWTKGLSLSVCRGGEQLLGSPIDVRSITRVEGFVQSAGGAITGWCWLPAEPWQTPAVSIGGRMVMADLPVFEHSPENPFAEPRGFALSVEDVGKITAPIDVIGPHQRRLYGAPLDPAAETASAFAVARALARRFPATGEPKPLLDSPGFISIQADVRGAAPTHPMPDLSGRRVLIVIPVYLDLEVTLDCLASVLSAKTEIEDVMVIVDGSPDRELIERLQSFPGDFTLLVRPINAGFPATANFGMRAAAGRDVVLLNSDTLVPVGWIAELRRANYSGNDIGTATALSNAATIFSYPATDKPNPIPNFAEVTATAALAQQENGGVAIDVPTAHGFCMYIRAECLTDTGLFREDLFGQGYGEENDFSLRAHHLGWRHVAAAGCFVGHREGVSFGIAKKQLTKRNLATLNRLHPGYDKIIEQWGETDPLFPARHRMDLARWRQDRQDRAAVLIITHDRGGGVARRVAERVREIEQQNRRAIVLRPNARGTGISAGFDEAYPNLIFPDQTELLEFLRSSEIVSAEIHHFLGHSAALIDELIANFPVYDVILHDYAWYCPRITLTAREDRYCGEPDVRQCMWCVADNGTKLEEDIDPVALHQRSLRLLQNARDIIAPSADTARRYSRRFGLKSRHQPWEDESAPLKLRPLTKPAGALRRIAVVGAISYQKGYDLLLQAARLVATKKLPIEFVVVGFTADDPRLLATGVVRITGHYQEKEVVPVIQAQDADFAFLPAQWPETWSYVLTQIWQAGLPVIALDLGAPAERIKARKGGVVIPPHLPVERMVAMFLDPGLFRAA